MVRHTCMNRLYRAMGPPPLAMRIRICPECLAEFVVQQARVMEDQGGVN